MEYHIEIHKKKYYKAALSVINCFLELTDYELSVISEMLYYKTLTLTKDVRKNLISILNTKEHTLNNYIKRLKDKKVLIKQNSNLTIHPSIINAVKDKEIIIKFNVSENDDL